MPTAPRLTFLQGGAANVGLVPAQEPRNFLYTYLAKRKVVEFDRTVDIDRTRGVPDDLRYLVSKVARLANASHERSGEYSALCRKVLGFEVSAHAATGGMQAGIPIGRFDHIPIEAMGEGVSSLLGLIADLCMADGNLFLIEELENDIHPEGLKAILEAIVAKSRNNQFIISTHSNIVVKYLGSAPGSKILSVTSSYDSAGLPKSHIRPIEPTPEARMVVLRDLGYELYDFDLWEGWLILEEASAEVIIKDYLIPWFAPKLSRLRTLSANGTGRVEATFDDFRRLFLFTHLEPQYRGRAWVVVDGDATGQAVIEKLRDKYQGSWPVDHFRTFEESDFELYYPSRFTDQATEVLALPHKEKRVAKKELLEDVKEWCDRDPATARGAFEESAGEVIRLLREIEESLFGRHLGSR